MSEATWTTIHVHLVAVDPPLGREHGVCFGLQAKRDIDQLQPADKTTTFVTEIEIRTTPEGRDFRGPHVSGRKGDRSIYLSWGHLEPTDEFEMMARAKIKLNDIPNDLVRSVTLADTAPSSLTCHVQATNAKGQPATGTVNPANLDWDSRLT